MDNLERGSFKEFVVNALSYLDEVREEYDVVKSIHWTKDSIIIITTDNRKYLISIIDLGDVVSAVDDMEDLLETVEETY